MVFVRGRPGPDHVGVEEVNQRSRVLAVPSAGLAMHYVLDSLTRLLFWFHLYIPPHMTTYGMWGYRLLQPKQLLSLA